MYFWMFNLETNRVITTRDIIWLNKTYGEYKQIDNEITVDDSDDNNEDYQYFKEEDGRDQRTGRD